MSITDSKEGEAEYFNVKFCQAVDVRGVVCNAISEHQCLCRIKIEGKDIIETIQMCHKHFLQQKAIEYGKDRV